LSHSALVPTVCDSRLPQGARSARILQVPSGVRRMGLG